MRNETAATRSIDTDDNLYAFGELDADDDQGEDFDDFEAGAGDADFGDFDDGFQQPSIVTDGSSDTSRVGSTKQDLSSPPSPFVSGSIVETAALAYRLSSFFDIRNISSVADVRSSSSPFLILASLTQQTTWSRLARHILTPYFPPLGPHGLLLYPHRLRTIQSSLPIAASHYGHSLWLHHLYSLPTGFVRAYAVCFSCLSECQ